MNWRQTNPAISASRILGLILLSFMLLAVCSLAHDTGILAF